MDIRGYPRVYTGSEDFSLLLFWIYFTIWVGCETWTITKTLQNRINGCYTKLLRYACNISWKSYTSNNKLYGKLEHIDTRIKRRRLQFAGHCYRSNEQFQIYSSMKQNHQLNEKI